MFDSPGHTFLVLSQVGYFTDQRTATTVHLAGKINKPIMLEGPAGAEKTELAQSVGRAAGADLLRLQYYQGINEEKAIGQFDKSLQELFVLLGCTPRLLNEQTLALCLLNLYATLILTCRSNTMQITSKGQVTIPQSVRNRLGLLPHTEVEFELAEDHARIRKLDRKAGTGVRGSKALEALRGTADSRMSTDEILALTRNENSPGRPRK